MQKSILPILLAAAVVLGGCSGLAFGGNETPTQTVTPAAVPTDEPTPTPVPQLAPGLTGQGVVDPFALGDGHAAVLDNTSYTMQENFTVRYANGTVVNGVTIRTQMASDSRFYLVQNGFGMNVRGSGGLSMWSNGERVLQARASNGNTSYTSPRGVTGEPVPPQEAIGALGTDSTHKEQIYELFGSVATRVTDREQRNGTTVYRVESTNVTNPTAFEGARWQNPRNFTMVARIDSTGLVRELRVNYTATVNDSTVRVHRRVRYTNLGNTTVKRPPWYDEAIANVSATTTAG
ncbi:DUF7537 family lipoprotein [Halococcus sp. AFM35]|uniref:DUF7537 family lipoprotein n=1 Tax=Halococcus sp. AFM35 TaxID=3421653 RepID=UPI003EC0ADE1